MASGIDSSKPITGSPTTQSVRDNFSAAKDEINELHRITEDSVTAGGTVDAITADFTNDVVLAEGVTICVKASGANTSTTPTLNVDSTGAKTIVKDSGDTLAAGDIGGSRHYCIFKYDATNTVWVLMNPTGLDGQDGAYYLNRTNHTGTQGISTVSGLQTSLDSKVSISSKLHAGYIDGLESSNAADADHDITISAGACRDNSDAHDMNLVSALTKQIDAAWVAGDNAGGLFSGTVAADTTYHLFLIRKDSDGSIDAGFDTSITAANIPAGYTSYRRVISIVTDGSANIIGFTAVETAGGGIRVTLNDPIIELDTSAPGTSGVLLTMTVPAGVQVVSRVFLYLNDSSSAVVYLSEVSQTDTAPATPHFTAVVSAGATIASTTIDLLTNTSGQIRYRSTVGSGLSGFQIILHGWTDFRR